MRQLSLASALGPALAAVLAAGLAGCDEGKFDLKAPWDAASARKPEPAAQQVPSPIHLLLPKEIRLHPFTGTRTFDEAGGVKGIDVRVEALDSYGDAAKAFGIFQFALYQYRPDSANPKGRRIATWEEDLLDPRKNLLHWDSITRAYAFKLQWYKPIPVGGKFVLTVDFTSPFTERRSAERVFVSGQ